MNMKLNEISPLDDAISWVNKHIGAKARVARSMIQQLRSLYMNSEPDKVIATDHLNLQAKQFPDGWVSPPFKISAEQVHLYGFDTKDSRFDWIQSCDSLVIHDYEEGEVSDIRVDEIANIQGLSGFSVLADINHCKRIVNIFDLIGSVTVQLRVSKNRTDDTDFAIWIYNNDANIQGKRVNFNSIFDLQEILIDNGFEDLV
ncbi:hypothetical protein RsoM2USA_308 [Ralstonia phage RsoM2USA]|nr:hypothetical protein RsoM2USA_308 [Ralstonia phage RsoM2USA]